MPPEATSKRTGKSLAYILSSANPEYLLTGVNHEWWEPVKLVTKIRRIANEPVRDYNTSTGLQRVPKIHVIWDILIRSLQTLAQLTAHSETICESGCTDVL